MKKLFLTLAVFALITDVYGQETEKNKTDAKGRKQGYWEKTNDKNVLLYTGQFKDNKPVGEFVFYYPNGKVKSIVNHMPDGKTSRARIYYMSGKIMSYGRYTSQKKDSVWTHYDEAGWVSMREPYVADKLEGKVQIYFHTGKLSETYEYKGGVRHGEWQRFFESGITMLKGTYKNNALNGMVTHYRPNGMRENTEMYLNGRKYGPMVYFDENGKEVHTDYYKMDKKLEGKELEEFKKKISQPANTINKTAPTKNPPAKSPAGNTQQKANPGANKTAPKTGK